MKKLTLLLTVLCVFVPAAAAQDWAKPRLEKTTRHYEYVKVMNGTREVTAFITYPEVKTKATALVLLHDNQGLTDWARGMTDQGAEAGYITIAPDLAVEVVSPNDIYYEVEAKVDEYLSAGVRLVWVVNPVNKSVRVFQPGRIVDEFGPDGELTGGGVIPGFTCSVRSLFPVKL